MHLLDSDRTPRTYSFGRLIFLLVLVLLMVTATTAVTALIIHFVPINGVGDIYLIPVLISALLWGLVPALIATVLSIMASAFFFYPPAYSFHIDDPDQFLDLVLFTVVSIVTSQLATSLKRHTEIAKMRALTDGLREALIGSVSHELRTPLSSIVGAASVILEAPATARDVRLSELANMIRDEAERLDSDIQNLLDAARITSEGVRPKSECIDPADIINVAVDRRRRRLSHHRLSRQIPDELPFVQGDPVLIDEALGQILDNAAKYSPIGSAIRVLANVEDGHVVISVIDDGSGIAAHEQHRLTQRFYRGERHVSTTTGSGLGLWIAHAFITACGGQVEVASGGIDRGAKVSIRLDAVTNTAGERVRETHG